MIKELGSIGFFVRYTSDGLSTARLSTIYDSYDKDNPIAQISINYSNNTLSASSSLVSASVFVDGVFSSSVSARRWQHVSVTFSPKISIDSSKDFIVEFGSVANTNNIFIQNVYMNSNSIQGEVEARLINSAFNGSEVGIKNTVTASVKDIIFIDYPETNYEATQRNVAYQPRFGQKRFLTDVLATGTGGCLNYFNEAENSYGLIGDQFFVDLVKIEPSDRVLARNNGKVISVNSNGTFSQVSSSVGDIVYVLQGNRHRGKHYLKTASTTWEEVEMIVKYNISEYEEEPIVF